MPKLAYSHIDRHLASGKLAPAYILTGEQDLLRELALEKIRVAALGDAPDAFNLERFDGEKSTAESVVMAGNTLPLLGLGAERRVLIVKRAKRLIEGTQAEPLIDYLGNPSPQTVLILELEASPDGRRKAWKQIAKNAVVVQCDPLKDWQVGDWIAEQAKNKGLTLGSEEVRYLASEFGSDLRRQLGELEKISLYADKEKLGVEALGALLGRGKAQSIFRFTDAFSSRQTATALKQLGRLLEEGEPPLRILALIDRALGQLLVAKELGHRPGRGRHLTQLLRIPPQAGENIARWSDAFEEKELVAAVRGLARCDRQLKTSGMPASLILESFVLSVCGVPEPAGRLSVRS